MVATVFSDGAFQWAQVLPFVAENERAVMRQRQAERIKMAKLRGVRLGKPKAPSSDNLDAIINSYLSGEITSKVACEMSGLTRGTFFRRLKERR